MYKDRLARFGFELIETIIKEASNGKITIINQTDDSPEEELTKDLVSIINVFSAKLNGMRKYKNK
jgi:predicted site-specific integrase-resolvase